MTQPSRDAERWKSARKTAALDDLAGALAWLGAWAAYNQLTGAEALGDVAANSIAFAFFLVVGFLLLSDASRRLEELGAARPRAERDE